MATSFSNRITSLRKERGLSQKEVAMSLGVSQALLSHYEKGVRECGLDFVLKCAEYFGVTTDYLLGKDDSKYGIYKTYSSDDAESVYSIKTDKIDMRTILMCINLFAERFSTMDPRLGDKLLWGAAIAEYKILVASIAAGRIDGFLEKYLHIWDYAAGTLLIREAGGAVLEYDGTDFTMKMVGCVIAGTKPVAKILADEYAIR